MEKFFLSLTIIIEVAKTVKIIERKLLTRTLKKQNEFSFHWMETAAQGWVC